jgi:hypothetical protein
MKVLPRLLTREFNVRDAQPLEKARYNISDQITGLHFEKCDAVGVDNIPPQLILNLDETGCGALTSGPMKGGGTGVSNKASIRTTSPRRARAVAITISSTHSLSGSQKLSDKSNLD